MLSKHKIIHLFERIDAELYKQNLRGEIGVVGGAALCLLFDERKSTKDIDAIFAPTTIIREMIEEIATEESLPSDWLNDAVKGFFPDEDPKENFVYNGKALKVWVPNLEYLFAMKALSSRVDTTDLEDIKLLITKIPIKTLSEALDILHNYYPQGRILQKTYYVLEELFSTGDK